MNKSMRKNYNDFGVDQFYSQVVSETYRNPHEPQIRKILLQFLDIYYSQLNLKPERLLFCDLACGSGEATLSIQEWHSQKCPEQKIEIIATDPFTKIAYEDRTGLTCLPLSFEDISQGQLRSHLPSDAQEIKNDVCICSFALHLCPESYLFPLLYELSQLFKYLWIISPHKKPILNNCENMGWQMVGKEIVIDRVHFRIYKSLD